MVLSALAEALLEPMDRRKLFVKWDVGSGGSNRRKQELSGRIRVWTLTRLCTARVAGGFGAIRRLDSDYRIPEFDEALLNDLAEFIVRIQELYREGDEEWWAITRLEWIPERRAEQLGLHVQPDAPRFAMDADHLEILYVPNPLYGDTTRPNMGADFGFYIVGETASAERFGASLEMKSLRQWAEALATSLEKVLNTKTATRSDHTQSLKKLDALRELARFYDRNSSDAESYPENFTMFNSTLDRVDRLLGDVDLLVEQKKEAKRVLLV